MSDSKMSMAGITSCLEEIQNISITDVLEDQQSEIEAMESAIDFDSCLEQDPEYVRAPNEINKKQKLAHESDSNTLEKHVEKASENVIVPSTLHEYRRLWNTFTDFCIQWNLIKSSDNHDGFWRALPPKLPLWIAAWIMHKADDLDITTGQPKDLSIPRVGYARAQKMRAAISHKYGREYKLGTQVWLENTLQPGTFSGNPSLSPVVSQYMISLRRRKVRAGEVITSACSMDQQTMRKLWQYNTTFQNENEPQPGSQKRKLERPEEWGGHNFRQMLQTLYVVSMLCLLRYDEALRIMWTDVEFTQIDGTHVVKLELPFCKTNQYGGIAPFWLWPDKERPWMDGVFALAKWWRLSKEMGIERHGYVFRRKHGYDQVSLAAEDALTSQSFLEYFRNNMVDIGTDPRPYGTHSF